MNTELDEVLNRQFVQAEKVFSGWGEREEEDAGGVEVHVWGVVDEGPHVGDEELLRRFLFHVLKLQIRKFLKYQPKQQ